MRNADVAPVITTPEEVLDGLAGARDRLRRIEQGNVILAVEWAKHHPARGRPRASLPVGPAPSRFEVGGRVWAELAAMGCVHFDDLYLSEFAVAAGLTEHSARKLLRESLMLVHLLPRVWHRVLENGLDVWRARALAADCWGLTAEAIEFVDGQMADLTAHITQTTRERIIDEARRKYAPEEQRAAEEEAKCRRNVEIWVDREENGIVPFFGELDLTDALALEAALATGAQALKDLGSDAPLPVRRAWALGDLARAASGAGTLLHFGSQEGPLNGQRPWAAAGTAGDPPDVGARPFWNGKGAFPPQVKLFVHLPATSVPAPSIPASTTTDCPHCSRGAPPEAGYVEGRGLNGTKVFSPELIKEWFTRPTLAGGFAPPVSIRNVLNTENYYGASGYAPTDRLRDQVQLLSNTCVFPFCSASSWKCDADHNEPWKPAGEGGATCSCNLAPLCRRHHRLKTHSDEQRNSKESHVDGEHAAWAYAHLGEDEYYWRGPRGLGFIRTNRGTYEVAGGGATGAPLHEMAPRTRAERAGHAGEAVEKLLDAARANRPEEHSDLVEIRFAPGEKVPLTSRQAAVYAKRHEERRRARRSSIKNEMTSRAATARRRGRGSLKGSGVGELA